MRSNLIDVNHLLTIIPSEDSLQSSQHSHQILKSANSGSSSNLGAGLASRVSNASNKILSRKMSQKSNIKSKMIYEIVDKKKIMLYKNQTAANSYTFDRIKQQNPDLNGVADWILKTDKKKSVKFQQCDINTQCKIILVHNYELSNYYSLLIALGKNLLKQGITFHIITAFSKVGEETCSSARDGKERRSMSMNRIKTFGQSIYSQQQSLSKSINFVSQLKQYLNQLKILNFSIDRVWFLTQSFQLAIGAYDPQKSQHAIKLIHKLTFDYENFVKNQIVPKKYSNPINFNVEILTLCQTPEQKAFQKAKRVLEQAILLKHCIKCYGLQQKQSLFSFRDSQNDQIRYSQMNEQQIKNYHNSKSKQSFNNTLQERTNISYAMKSMVDKKNSQSKINYLPNQVGNLDENNLMRKGNKKYQVQQQSQLSEESSLSSKKKKIARRKCSNSKFSQETNVQSTLASIMAENIHLKWQLQKIQKEYEQQSQKYVQKTNKKFENLREQRSYCLQESAKLRRDNQQLIEELNQLKLSYQNILRSRSDYQNQLEEKYKTSSYAVQSDYKQQVKQLQSQIKTLNDEKNYMQKQINEAKAALQDGRRRNRDRIQEMQQQVTKYKKFSQEIKSAYDQLERQSRMDKNRCENLQIRCKKYQQSLSDLLKLKNGSSVWSEDRSSQYASNSSQYQVANKAFQIIRQEKGTIQKDFRDYQSSSNSRKSSDEFKKKEQQTTKRKSQRQYRNFGQIKDRIQGNMIKNKQPNQEGKKEKQRKKKKSEYDNAKKQIQQIKHFRLMSFADGQK